jgi:hypothetical protein
LNFGEAHASSTLAWCATIGTAFLTKIPRTLAATASCADGYRQIRERSMTSAVTSTSLVAIRERPIVDELDKNGVARIGWCFVPKGYLVEGDVMLVQKISLETNERAALAAANRFTPATGASRRGRRVDRRPFCLEAL